MVKEQLEVFARIKPSSDPQNRVAYSLSGSQICIDVNRSKLSNAKQSHDFSFAKIFRQDSQQNQIFNNVAKSVIDNCLEGYNGTIFAYGQTGSGKTFTMSGGDKWEQRGIIPRVLSYIFSQFRAKAAQYEYSLSVSFIEIYNENGYDLLDENHTQANIENWTKIVFMEDQDANLQMKNVQAHPCETEEEGINYLMMGNYIRRINSTSLNQVSSRSHCIFTLNILGRDRHTLAEVYSKIHLVDLAGSERVSKSHAEGIVLTEAKSINLSLTYLEQVIVSLNQKSKYGKTKSHIPYRNSLLTTLLKDSLGGNCKTVMIATISVENSNIQESISTLRFSQRVKKIENEISKNEKNIYSNQIETLQKQNAALRKKLQKYQKQNQSSNNNNKVTQSSQEQLREKVQSFMKDKSKKLQVANMNEAQSCFFRMRDLYNRKMREYATQLTFISEKLQKYDEILTKKQNSRKQNSMLSQNFGYSNY